jgi:hypothetical protein
MRKACFAVVGAFIAALTLLPSMSTPSHALIITDLGNNPNSATGHFSNSVLGTTFDDQFTFHLVGAQFVTIASATNDFLSASDFITNFTGQLFSSGPNGLPGGGDDVAINIPIHAVPCPSDPTGCQVLAGSALLAGGNYFLDISGVGGGTAGYGGDLTTAAVPLPLAGAGIPGLLAALFGLLGLRWRRREC